ncbi:MAG TPA: LLM class F420-dependent oxidoreductase [Acidimicrobiia bacterium]|nr:LLM class F420-dependent oxidoreductase [Acidimicrobiia bacterium]
MRLGVNLGGRDAAALLGVARRAESLGFDSLWRGEAYGGDAVVPLAMAAAVTERVTLGSAILQMPARTPTMTAMTAMHLDELTGGRFVLGLGMSGPQVVEGWHGVPYGRPLRTTEEYVAIVRRIFAGDERVEFSGDRYRIPYDGDDATGLGKAMRPGLHTRADIPVYLAAIGPKNVALATRIADGLLPILWSPTGWRDALDGALDGVDLDRFRIVATVPVAVGDDVQECRDAVKPFLALYVGGMGAKEKNFYNRLVRRYGYESAAIEIQDRYLSGDRKGAIAAVPDALVDDLALVGPKERIAEHLEPWLTCGIHTLTIATPRSAAMTTLAELVL